MPASKHTLLQSDAFDPVSKLDAVALLRQQTASSPAATAALQVVADREGVEDAA